MRYCTGSRDDYKPDYNELAQLANTDFFTWDNATPGLVKTLRTHLTLVFATKTISLEETSLVY